METLKSSGFKKANAHSRHEFSSCINITFPPLRKRYLLSFLHTSLASFVYGLYSMFILLSGFITVSVCQLTSFKLLDNWGQFQQCPLKHSNNRITKGRQCQVCFTYCFSLPVSTKTFKHSCHKRKAVSSLFGLLLFIAFVRNLSLLFCLAVCYFMKFLQLRGLIKYKDDNLISLSLHRAFWSLFNLHSPTNALIYRVFHDFRT